MTLLPRQNTIEPRPQGDLSLALLGYALSFALAVYMFSFVLPRKGAAFGDEGFYLDIAWRAAKGEDFSLFFSQAPFFLVLAGLMKLGATEYLLLREIFYAFLLACYFYFPLALGGPAGAARGVAMGFGIGLTVTSLFSYQNAPVVLCLTALGLYFRERDLGGPQGWRSYLAGALLALAGFVNFTLYPAVGLALLGILLIEGRLTALWRITLACALCSLAMLGSYVAAVGLKTIITIPAGHPIHSDRFTVTAMYLLKWLGFWIVAVGACRLISRIFRPGSLLARFFGAPELAFMPAMCLYYLLCMLRSVLKIAGYDDLAWNMPTLKLHQTQLMSFFGLGLMCLALVSASRGSRDYRRVLLCAVICVALWLLQTFFSDVHLSLSGLFYCAPMAILGYYLISRDTLSRYPGKLPAGPWLSLASSAVLLCAIGAAFTINWNHPGDTTILGPKVELKLPHFKGILETPERVETFERIIAAYEQNGCKNKNFVTFRLTNLLNFIFENAHKTFGYIHPRFYLQEEMLKNELEQSPNGWCVLLSHNYEGFAEPEKEKSFLDYLKQHSQKIVPLAGNQPAHVYDDFTLYVGPKKP